MWQRLKAQWLASQEAKLQAEFAPRLKAVEESLSMQEQTLEAKRQDVASQQHLLEVKLRDVEDAKRRLADRQVELAQTSEETRTQIRLLEAKASPDNVWVEAFSRGYEKAWETMWPFFESNLTRVKEVIRRVAIDETLTNLQGEVEKRATVLGQVAVQDKVALLAKQTEFRTRRASAKVPAEREKYDHYLTALDWMLNGHQLPQDQTLPQ